MCADRKRPLALPVTGPTAGGLGAPTIMDRALAAKHGARYVRLAAFAIDVDRIYDATADAAGLHADREGAVWVDGWEVLLTEAYVLRHFDPARSDCRAIVEDACLAIVEQPESGHLFGSQLPFAVHDAMVRGAWPDLRKTLFSQWGPASHKANLRWTNVWTEDASAIRRMAARCLQMPIEPPLAPPTLQALKELSAL